MNFIERLFHNGRLVTMEFDKFVKINGIDISKEDFNRYIDGLIGKIFAVIRDIAKEQGFADEGYRVISNCGINGGQEVPHLHFHIIGGKKLGDKIV